MAVSLVVFSAFVSRAWACPGPWSGATCNGGSGTDTCVPVYGTQWSCYLQRNGGTSDGTGYLIYDDGGSVCAADTYCSFGNDNRGNAYCCEIAATGIDTVYLDGGSPIGAAVASDTLSFLYPAIAALELTNRSGQVLVAYMSGKNGDDTLNGSNSASASFSERLDAGAGNDVIHANDGADTLSGDGGDDTLYGEDGADFVDGGPGNDILSGGAGNDTVNGRDGNDAIAGGTGVDTLYGENDDDKICGDSGSGDTLSGGAGADVIYGADAGDAGNAGGGLDSCDATGTYLSCEDATVSSRPAACPRS